MKPAQYIERRLEPKLRFYRDRLPRYSRYRTFWQIMIFIGSGTSALLTTYDLTIYVAIVTALVNAANSWLEVKDHGRKMERYTNVIMAIYFERGIRGSAVEDR